MGIHSPKNCVEAEVGPSWRAQALLVDSFIQSLLWLLWASPRFSPESHCPPGQARHSPALPFLLCSPAPRECARDRGCGLRAQRGLPPTASHRHVLPKHLLCTLHTGVRHGPRRPYLGCPLLDVLHPPPHPGPVSGRGPEAGPQITVAAFARAHVPSGLSLHGMCGGTLRPASRSPGCRGVPRTPPAACWPALPAATSPAGLENGFYSPPCLWAGREGQAAGVWGSVDPTVCDSCSQWPLGPKTATGSAHVNGDGSVTGSH